MSHSAAPRRWSALLPLALLLWLGATAADQGPRLPLLLAIGAALGLTLHRGRFGFTGAYRRLFLLRQTEGVQAQLLMIALATLLFAPLLARGEVGGTPLWGAWAPPGLQVAAGAFLFGIGMQLAGGCGSGSLFAAGGGSPRMALVLVAFCAGSFVASLQMGWWQRLPGIDTVALGERLGWSWATGLQLALLATLALALRRWGRPAPASPRPPLGHRLWAGPWPLPLAATLLALLNLATLVTAGHPWTITWAFSLWGAKGATLLGWTPAPGSFWTAPFQQQALAGTLLADDTSVMNLGILLGAALSALLAGDFRPRFERRFRPWLAAVVGGLLLGYGARIAYGCNIGAFFSGVASGSLHGWLWIACALPGNWIGIRLRPRFGLANP